MSVDSPKRNPARTEAELMLALDAYFTIREQGEEPSASNPRIKQTSEALNSLSIHPLEKRNSKFRDPDGVRRRFWYFRKLEAGDDINGREAYRRVWERYKDDAEQLRVDAAEVSDGVYASAEALESDPYESLMRDLSLVRQDEGLTDTEREALVSARKGQGQFRRELIALWKGCAVTGCKNQALLVASHIKPSATASNGERLDPYNGILLSPVWDRLFDKGYVSFANDGTLLLSDYLSAGDRKALCIESNGELEFQGRHLRYVTYHRKHVFKS